MSRHAVLLCEGYHDRAFWAGVLRERGWSDARDASGKAHDPLGKLVRDGRYAFRKNEHFVVVVPCLGAPNIAPAARQQFLAAKLDTGRAGCIDQVVACFDGDAGELGSVQSIRDRWKEAFGATPPSTPSWTQDGLRVDVLFLHSSDPRYSTSLDGLVASAFAEAQPERDHAIRSWLSDRPDPPAKPSKETMWSIMAGWFAEQGCDSFLQHGLWSDAAVRERVLLAVDRCQLTPMLDALET